METTASIYFFYTARLFATSVDLETKMFISLVEAEPVLICRLPTAGMHLSPMQLSCRRAVLVFESSHRPGLFSEDVVTAHVETWPLTVAAKSNTCDAAHAKRARAAA